MCFYVDYKVGLKNKTNEWYYVDIDAILIAIAALEQKKLWNRAYQLSFEAKRTWIDTKLLTLSLSLYS